MASGEIGYLVDWKCYYRIRKYHDPAEVARVYPKRRAIGDVRTKKKKRGRPSKEALARRAAEAPQDAND
jgi:hypothetical protein